MTKNEALAELERLKIKHYHCDDGYYCCPQCDHEDHTWRDRSGACNCAAPAHNARVDAVIAYVARVVPLTIGGVLSREVR